MLPFRRRRPYKGPMEHAPVIPKPAASVLLLRDGPRGIEVFMVLRSPKLNFSSGALVFPGGKIDPEDGDPALAARSPGAEGLDGGDRTHRIAAIREAFEETGILLARRRGTDGPVAAADAALLEGRWRPGVHSGSVSFLRFLETEDLLLKTADLRHFAHWITPEPSERRFDVHFYLAAAPAGHEGAHDGSESVDSLWIRPGDALEDAAHGRRPLMFPTRSNLSRLARSATVAEALARAEEERVETVMTRIVTTPEGRVLRIPRSAGYPLSEIPAEGD